MTRVGKDDVIKRFVSRTSASRKMTERARRVMPDGVGTDFEYLDPYPVCVDRALGSRVHDMDGNEYVDFLMGAGAIVLGHTHPAVVEAAQRQIQRFSHIKLFNETEVLLAEKISKHVPSAERIRFLPSGSEAAQLAARIARAYTGRGKIAKMEGGYQGQVDNFLVSVHPAAEKRGPEVSPVGTPHGSGIPKELVDNVVVLPFNSVEPAVTLIEKNSKDLAAVFVEPVLGAGGAIPADREFLRELRKVTEENGIALVFDEVITGFRVGLGGAQGYYGVYPDLTIFGKIMGGGFPVGAVGGNSELMDTVSREARKGESKVYQSGTFGSHPVTMAAGLAVLEELERDPSIYAHMNALGQELRGGMKALFSELDVKAQVTGMSSMFLVHFTDRAVRNGRDAADADQQKLFEFHFRLLEKGIITLQGHLGFLSAAHRSEDVRQKIETSRFVLQEMEASR